MKKIVLTLAALTILLLTSCEKTWYCTTTTSYDGVSEKSYSTIESRTNPSEKESSGKYTKDRVCSKDKETRKFAPPKF